ncbi:MAG: PIG-L deacetylase family protein [Gammaproteobacteria bacterium]
MHQLGLASNKAVRRLLCLGAHCDDIEIGCGATLLTLLAANPDISVDWVVFSGAGNRETETRAAASDFLPASTKSQLTVHDFRDGYFPDEWGRLKACFAELGARIAPDLVLTHYRHDLHQDHRTIAEMTWQTFRNRLIWEYEIPKFDGDLGRPNLFVPVTEAVAARKIDILLRSFPSQASKNWFSATTFNALLRLRGIESGASTGLAEAFHAAKTVVQVSTPEASAS